MRANSGDVGQHEPDAVAGLDAALAQEAGDLSARAVQVGERQLDVSEQERRLLALFGGAAPQVLSEARRYSARSAAEWDRFAEALSAFELVETTADHLRRARQVQRLLAAKHQRGRKVPDLLIAAAGEVANLTILHYDADFDRIAAVTGQRCEWVVPAGSVD